MKRSIRFWFTSILLIFCLIILRNAGFADDICIFGVTADEVPPNIVILLDNGAEMEQIIRHSGFDDSTDYTPAVEVQTDVVPNGTGSNGFFNQNGYGIVSHGGLYYLVRIMGNLLLDSYTNGLQADSSDATSQTGTWTINSRTMTLPAEPYTVAVNGVIDNATNLRYSKNYLNWIFFSTGAGSYVDVSAVDDGSDLPHMSRFYYAKKAIMAVAKITSNQASFGIYYFANDEGASQAQPIALVVDTVAELPDNNILDPNFINNINNMGTVTYSPLAEGLATIGGYYNSPSSGVVGEYCQKSFNIVVSSGVSSEDLTGANQYVPTTLSDYDGDNAAGGIGEGNIKENSSTYSIPTNQNGSSYLDDVAHYLYTHDIVGYQDGFQNVMTYTVGFMGNRLSNLFLINTSNNGNGNVNLYDTTNPEYGKYHFTAESPDSLSSVLIAAVNDIVSRTSTFMAPVVPVTRTTSGNRIYMAFFKPANGNFWEGNVAKFGLSNNNEIVDSNGNAATWPNGAMRQDAVPYWQTKDWADSLKSNYVHNSNRNIYTYLGSSRNLTDSSNEFKSVNSRLKAAVLGNPTHTTGEIINYVRGADVLDEDIDGNTSENREIITGDVLHSEPLIVQYNSTTSMVYFGANDGMLHAVSDSDGTEAWAFIPPDQLHKLKDMVEGSGHQIYVDSSPKAYIKDVDDDEVIESGDGDQVIIVCGERKGGTSYFALDVTDPVAPILLWRISNSNDSGFGILRLGSIFRNSGGTFQDGDPLRLWDWAGGWDNDATVDGAETIDGSGYVVVCYDNRTIPFSVGDWVGNLTTAVYQDWLNSLPTPPFVWGRIVSIEHTDPDVVIPELGQTWSEPEFRLVKTADNDEVGTPVFFIGGGYSADNSLGKAVLAINVLTGAVVRKFKNDGINITAMNYGFASSACVVPSDAISFVDKVYVGDLGGQMWRLGKFTDSAGNPLAFPNSDKNIMNWTAQILLVSDSTHTRKFFYKPSVTLEKGYDLVFMGTGNRDDACNTTSSDRIYSVKDTHSSVPLQEADLVDVTDPAALTPNLDSANGDVDNNGSVDQGWYIQLATGEKVLAEGTVFYKAYYVTTFTPNNEPCLPGGVGKFYALSYKTGAAVLALGGGSLTRSVEIGGGIPSKPVMVITPAGQKLFVSVGSANPEASSEVVGAGIVAINPLAPPINFFYLWWLEL